RHFVLLMHRDLDGDSVTCKDDRQRCEIKVYDKSRPEELRAHDGDTFVYQWSFRVGPEMAVSKNFTHIFQLKSVGENSRFPLLTLTGRRDGGDEELCLIHRAQDIEEDNGDVLGRSSWAAARSSWLRVICRVTYGRAGQLEVSVSRQDGTVVLAAE